ncbi:YrvL family regulatory protein [Aquibacillus kalidii]|uniref:YrvL family regulatory protein n=1 Tax=Aquibacillus kalidii TaxID=2762597 RepID=UPI0016445CE5|nr:YrvL family regulatory protein [Aquibacillus kalidii]
MPEPNKDSFHGRNRDGKMATIFGITFFILLVICFVLGLYFFGIVGVFELLGVQYKSIWSLFIFVFSFFILGIFVELFTKVFYELSTRNINGIATLFFIRISFESASNWLVLFMVDEFMSSIILSLRIEIIIALLIALVEIAIDDTKE